MPRLSDSQIIDIAEEKRLHNAHIAAGRRDTKPMNADNIAIKYGCSRYTVYKIINRKGSRYRLLLDSSRETEASCP
jgi:hypothetical protein